MSKIAFISTAHIHTRGFLETFRSASDGRILHVIWDADEDRGRRFAESHATAFEPNLAKIVADQEIDGFIICSETSAHIELLETLVPLRKPILCDKPLVVSAKELKRLRKLLAAGHAPLLTGYFMPHFGDHRAVVNLLGGNFFGQVTRARFRSSHDAAYGHWFDNPDIAWLADPAKAGGGGFLDMGTHGIHLLRSLFGPVTEVFATVRNESGIYPETDDFGMALLKFESGVLGTVEAGWTQTGGPRQLEICGSEKCLWHDGLGYQIEGRSFPRESLYTIPNSPSRVDRLMAAIHGWIPEEELAEELALSLDAVEIMAACLKSAEKGKWVKV
jgi:myo-inositol 2-dehydrogenase / D-chiro-inositol 1-dehydrogenase